MRKFRLPSVRSLVASSGVIAVALAAAPVCAKSYEYDTLGRVTKVIYDDGSYVIYTYDASGNRVTVSATKI